MEIFSRHVMQKNYKSIARNLGMHGSRARTKPDLRAINQ